MSLKPNQTHTFYKCCVVPRCSSTTISTPKKLFFYVPKDQAIRKKWCLAMKRDTKKSPISVTSTLHICEDHFNLKDDMENYWEYSLTGNVKRLKLKTGTVPHIFMCQSTKPIVDERKLPAKRKRMELINEVEAGQSSTATEMVEQVEEVQTRASCVAVDIEKSTEKCTLNKATQANIRAKFRSKGTNTDVVVTSVGVSPFKIAVMSVGTSPLAKRDKKNSFSDAETSSMSSSISSEMPEDLDYSLESVENDQVETENFKEYMLKGTIWSIERDPKLFLGLPLKSYHLIKMLSVKAPLPVRNILITIKKMKLNDSYAILGIDFGMSSSNISRIFNKTIVILSQYLQELIYWPDRKQIRRHLPIPFRVRYGKVVSIIDCLEIQIEKPSNPIHQSLTWSEYKKGNTLKYLISCTPDGLVSFISKGYGERASDVTILEDSSYLQKLESGVAVMADRGFKNVSSVIQQKGCTLIRPPSVSASGRSSSEDVKQSKQIVALRVHVERVIGRLRLFNMLLPHATTDNHLIPIIDHVIVCACAIINCQDHLFKIQN